MAFTILTFFLACFIDEFPEGVPVVFITSKVDEVIPNQSTKKLAIELARREKNHVYLLELKTSWHAHYPTQYLADREIYTHGLHAIYKIHGLPYIEDFAAKGVEIATRARLDRLPNPSPNEEAKMQTTAPDQVSTEAVEQTC